MVPAMLNAAALSHITMTAEVRQKLQVPLPTPKLWCLLVVPAGGFKVCMFPRSSGSRGTSKVSSVSWQLHHHMTE
jgi:hypothetical protein